MPYASLYVLLSRVAGRQVKPGTWRDQCKDILSRQ